jgi:hypothetical protein
MRKKLGLLAGMSRRRLHRARWGEERGGGSPDLFLEP